MSQRVGIDLHLPPEATKVHAAARSEVGLSLLGRARRAYERATGASVVPGEPPVIERNPQGSFGNDHSGPPFGAVPRTLVWSWAGRSTSSLVPSTTTPMVVSPRTILLRDDGLSLRNQRFYNRPYATLVAPLIAPHARLHLLYLIQATGSGSTQYEVRLRSLTMGTSATRTVTTNDGNIIAQALADTFLPAGPGINVFDVEWQRISGARNLEIIACGLYLRAKRAHGLTFPG